MPVFSYIAYPAQNARDELLKQLLKMDQCTAIPAENAEVIILVTDTPDEESEKRLQQQFKEMASLQSLSMTFGHADENTH